MPIEGIFANRGAMVAGISVGVVVVGSSWVGFWGIGRGFCRPFAHMQGSARVWYGGRYYTVLSLS